MSKPRYLIGYDVGGTKIQASLIQVSARGAPSPDELTVQRADGSSLYLSIKNSRRAPTERQFGYDHIVKTMAELLRGVCSDAGLTIFDIDGMGAALPGSVEPRTQRMVNGNTMALMGRDLVGDLAKALQFTKPIRASNDANCFALAEALCGAGVKHAASTRVPLTEQTCLGIILGTGTGGGIVVGGKMVVGNRGGAAEFGHSILIEGGHPCYCGRNGCAEQYLSGPALEAAFNQRHYAQIQGFPNAQEIFELYQKLDPVAVAIVKQYKKHLAMFLGNLVTIFDPDFVVLGGGVSTQPVIYEGLSELISQNTFIAEPGVPVYQYAISDAAGALGAALTLL